MTTYFSWRYVFAGEVIIVIAILFLARRAADDKLGERPHLDLIGAVISSAGLALIVLGVLKSSTWGWLLPKEGATSLFGLSLTIWFIMGGLFLLWLFLRWQNRLENGGKEPLISPALLRVRQLTGGLITFLFQFMIQAGLFFIVPLFLSVVLGLSPMATGVRLLPLSLSLLVAAVGIPKLVPKANPRRVVRIGMLALIAGIVVLIASLEVGADSSIVFVPMLIIGFGIGGLASQLGNVTVSSVPTEKSSEVGGLQNTASQLGASIGTALAGSILIAALTASFLSGIEANPNVPQSMKTQANTSLAAGAPFISDSQAQAQLEEAGVPDGRPGGHPHGLRGLADRRPAHGALDPGRDGRHLALLHRADTQEAAGLRAGSRVRLRSGRRTGFGLSAGVPPAGVVSRGSGVVHDATHDASHDAIGDAHLWRHAWHHRPVPDQGAGGPARDPDGPRPSV